MSGIIFLYYSGLGVSTYDAISLIIANTWHVWKFRYCRIVSDVVCVIIGTVLYLLAGGKVSGLTAIVGVGTIVTGIFMGPLIEFLIFMCHNHFYKRIKEVRNKMKK